MREISNYFKGRTEPDVSDIGGSSDSTSSVVVVQIDGSGFAPKDINSELLAGIEALLDTPQIIKEFHSMLHPLTEMIHEHESKGKIFPNKYVLYYKVGKYVLHSYKVSN